MGRQSDPGPGWQQENNLELSAVNSWELGDISGFHSRPTRLCFKGKACVLSETEADVP